jgi:hypothetical protein
VILIICAAGCAALKKVDEIITERNKREFTIKYILDRICLINDEIIIEDPEYQELMERVDEWKKQIAAKLPPGRERFQRSDDGRDHARLLGRRGKPGRGEDCCVSGFRSLN